MTSHIIYKYNNNAYKYIDFKLIRSALICSYSDSNGEQKTTGCISHGPMPEAAVETADCSEDAVTNAPMVMVTSANNI